MSASVRAPVARRPSAGLAASPEFVGIESDMSSFEPRFYAIVVAPIQRSLPPSVSPNAITLVSFVCILVFGMAAVAGVAAGPGSPGMLKAHVLIAVLQLVYTVCVRGPLVYVCVRVYESRARARRRCWTAWTGRTRARRGR